MSDESRFDPDADRQPLEEQTVTEDEPPPGAEPVADESTAESEDEEDEQDSQQARERRDGSGESIESDEGA